MGKTKSINAQASDRKFFERHPDRMYRLRRISREELELVGTVSYLDLEDGNVWVVVVQCWDRDLRTYQCFQMQRSAAVFTHMWDDFHCAFALHHGWLMAPTSVIRAIANRQVA